MCGLLFDNYWNYERYEERIIKHRAGIPVEFLWTERTYTFAADGIKGETAQDVGRTGAKRRTDGHAADSIGLISASEPNYPPKGQIYCLDGGLTEGSWCPWWWQPLFTMALGPQRERRSRRRGAGRKVSCGFTHPIIRALKTTLTIDAPEEVLGTKGRMDSIGSMDSRSWS